MKILMQHEFIYDEKENFLWVKEEMGIRKAYGL